MGSVPDAKQALCGEHLCTGIQDASLTVKQTAMFHGTHRNIMFQSVRPFWVTMPTMSHSIVSGLIETLRVGHHRSIGLLFVTL